MNGAGRVAAASSYAIFGRDEEFIHVSAFVDAIPLGPRSLLLEGEAGMGKTTIWTWALERAAAANYWVLSCRPAEAEAKLSYAALADLLSGVVDEAWPALPPPQRRALEVALLREGDAGETLDPRAVAVAVLATFRTLATSRPTLIAVDDAQWIDAPSARVLQFVTRRLQSGPFGVLVTQRTREDGGVAFELDRALPGDGFSKLLVRPLSLGALHHVVRARLGAEFPRSVLVQVHRASGGNPFYAIEIGRDLLEHGVEHGSGAVSVPKTLRELVERRLGRLPRRTQDVLLTVSALSHPTLALITAVAERPDLVEDDLNRASRAGIIEVEADQPRFSHPLLATVRYATASAEQRRTLHRRLAGVVVDVEERARHLALATTGFDSVVALSLDEAAARARARGAPEAAAALLDHALRLTPPDQSEAVWRRTSEAAMCHYLAGDSGRARELWEEVESSAPAGPTRAAALWHLTEFRHSSLDFQQRLEAAARALREAGDDLALKSAIEHTLALTLAWGGNVRMAEPHARTALKLAQALGDPTVLALARTAAGQVRFLSGRGISGELVDRTLALEKATGALPLENSPRLTWASMVAQVGEAPDAARRVFGELRRQAQESGLDISLPYLLFLMSDLECRTGDWDLASRYAVECTDVAARTEQAFRIPLGLIATAQLDARRGHLDAARVAAVEALSIASRVGPRYVEARIWAVLGFIELSSDNPEVALRWLGSLGELEESGGYGEPTVFSSAHERIEALIALGRLEEASPLVDRLEARGRALNRAWALATGARCRGLLYAVQGDLALAQSALERAIVVHARLNDPFELGRTLLALGNTQRRRRQKRAATASLQQAMTLFASLGAAGWASRAAAEIRRVGLAAAHRDQLSATEERVARLAAGGRTNREIASALFVSVKAVEANLTRIYAKLEVRSRTELALRLASSQM
jgi:DNA-binding CsgD family transcriptional regulator